MQGGEVKLAFISPGDRAGYFLHYGQGATAYSGGNALASADLFGAGNRVALGWLADGVFVNGSSIELTTASTVGAAFEHYWTPAWRSDLTGAYSRISYSAAAKAYFSDVGGCTPAAPTTAAQNRSTSHSPTATPTGNFCRPGWPRGGRRWMACSSA